MLFNIKTKIRSLIPDIAKSDSETFTYNTSAIFTLQESNIIDVSQVDKNGVALSSGEWSHDLTLSQVTVTESLMSNDIITVYYTFYKYSDTELTEYIRASIVWISYFGYNETDYELETTYISPTPDNKILDLIALIASILIKPDYSEYRLPNLTVKYPRTMCKEDRIEKLVSKFQYGLGVSDVLEFN